jgi:hypothetical protein
MIFYYKINIKLKMNSTKACSLCNQTKDISLYYKGRNQCKECYKNKYGCVHGKQKVRCKDCGGSAFCSHDKIKARCKDCGGSQICSHGKFKAQCKDCGGSAFCSHGKMKAYCNDCGGSSLCSHGIRKIICIKCEGSQICSHSKIKAQCKDCGGSSLCSHGKRKTQCIICNPDCACIECKHVLIDKRTICHPLCQACFCNKYPDHEKSTLYKIKERYLRDELRVRFPYKDINMIFDKTVDGGCSKKRPDVLIDLLLYSIIIECDEGQHKNYECENKRTMELFKDLGERPLIMIRFNPDSYTEDPGSSGKKKIEGCFKPLTNIEDIHKKKFYEINKKEWKRRVDILEETIKLKISENIPKKELEEIKLFYDYK